MGPVSAVCLSKAPKFKIKGYLVHSYPTALPWVIVKELITKLPQALNSEIPAFYTTKDHP